VLICAEEFKALLEELKKSGAATVAGSADKMLVDLVFSALDKDDRFRPLRSSLSALTATPTPNPSHLSVVFYHP
jgi:phosphoglycolate phosphatase-like HAD superfamily hydrolase